MASSKVPRTCTVCGTVFFQHQCVVNKGGGKFCSQKCYHTGHVKRVDKQCLQCGAPFQISPGRIARGDGKFCGIECRRASRRIDIADRFWDKVEKTEGCWLWIASRNATGYGSVNAGKEQRAHRVAYILTYGQIPEGDCVCHRCDNPACVRPDHLFLGSQIENIKDMVAKKRHRNGSSA